MGKKVDKNSLEYWNRVLSRKGLSVDAGRNKKLVYIGTTNDVERLDGIRRFGREKKNGE